MFDSRVAADQQAGRREEGDGEVYEKLLEMRRFRVFPHPEEAELALPGAPESVRWERLKETASTEAAGMYNR